jgi:hypothetical protein
VIAAFAVFETAGRNAPAHRALGNAAGWKDKAMRGVSPFGIWTCAAIYAAAGVFGFFFLTTQPNTMSATDGYGVIQVATQNAQ